MPKPQRPSSLWAQWLHTARRFAAQGELPVHRQLIEALLLKLCRNLGPRYFHRARFARRVLHWRDKWHHIDQREYERWVDALNPPAYQKASQHKVLEKANLRLSGLPTPRFIGFFHPQRGQDALGHWLRSLDDLQRLLRQHPGQRLCFKQVEGFGGSGFSAMDVLGEGEGLRHPVDGHQVALSDWHVHLCAEPDGWLIESFLPQHPDMAALNPSSVNTLRVWVLQVNEAARATHAIVRVGRAGDQVDNTSHGGVALPIDIQTGVTMAGVDLRNPLVLSTHHPDSGESMVGRTIPHWEATLDLAARALLAFPHMRFAGLDIAVGHDGPVVIELNVQPDRISALRWDLPLRRYFQQALPRLP